MQEIIITGTGTVEEKKKDFHNNNYFFNSSSLKCTHVCEINKWKVLYIMFTHVHIYICKNTKLTKIVKNPFKH